MGAILQHMYDVRQGHYVHAIEVDSVYTLKSSLEALYEEFYGEGYSNYQIKEFFSTIALYWLTDVEEDFDIDSYVEYLTKH